MESDKFRLEEELQQTKDELFKVKENNEQLNERLIQTVDIPTAITTSKTTQNGQCDAVDDVNTTTISNRNKSLNSKSIASGTKQQINNKARNLIVSSK